MDPGLMQPYLDPSPPRLHRRDPRTAAVAAPDAKEYLIAGTANPTGTSTGPTTGTPPSYPISPTVTTIGATSTSPPAPMKAPPPGVTTMRAPPPPRPPPGLADTKGLITGTLTTMQEAPAAEEPPLQGTGPVADPTAPPTPTEPVHPQPRETPQALPHPGLRGPGETGTTRQTPDLAQSVNQGPDPGQGGQATTTGRNTDSADNVTKQDTNSMDNNVTPIPEELATTGTTQTMPPTGTGTWIQTSATSRSDWGWTTTTTVATRPPSATTALSNQMNDQNLINPEFSISDPHHYHWNWPPSIGNYLHLPGKRSPGHLTPNNAFEYLVTGALCHWTGVPGARCWVSKGTRGGPQKSWTADTLPICGPPGPDGRPLTITIIWPKNFQGLELQAAEQANVHSDDFSRAPHPYAYLCRHCNARHHNSAEMQQHLLRSAGDRRPPLDVLFEWYHGAGGAGAPQLLRGTPMGNHLPFTTLLTNTMDMSLANRILTLRNNLIEDNAPPEETVDPAGQPTGGGHPIWTQRDMEITMDFHRQNTVALQQNQAALQNTVNQLQQTLYNNTTRNTAGSNPVIIEIPSATTERHQPPPN